MLLEECVCYDQRVLLAKLLAFAVLHLQGHDGKKDGAGRLHGAGDVPGTPLSNLGVSPSWQGSQTPQKKPPEKSTALGTFLAVQW